MTAWLARGPMSVADARATIARFEVHSDARDLGDHPALQQGHVLRRHMLFVAHVLTVRPAADLSA
ncbi:MULTISPECIES: hypothetical protein [unclassified Burkholderia]|uniref:hypothetical protein n=1 Tax=unclassified Burkholderia TaxID=2613784 RepID=UPI001E51C831|nr:MULTISPECIES: hypothetical protein [unclassified Burkholderia]UEP31317.1 hypothetical protein LMA01_19050 [Burkholderia sp. B21-007]UEP43435.1 hypothetical protein LMA02_25575 [Burkholderia sp. B21-005]